MEINIKKNEFDTKRELIKLKVKSIFERYFKNIRCSGYDHYCVWYGWIPARSIIEMEVSSVNNKKTLNVEIKEYYRYKFCKCSIEEFSTELGELFEVDIVNVEFTNFFKSDRYHW